MGPLDGYRFLELAGIGPTQLAGMLLAEMGAEVVRIEPLSGEDEFPLPPRFNLMNRSRRSIALDLKRPAGTACALRLVERADGLFEGFRPGVAERLGLGPESCFERNPAFVYGRMTGWGQRGPLAGAVGHDANYLALTGALHAIGEPDRPPAIPLNLVADFGGGSLYLVAGMLAALLEASRSGRGQVVDAAMVDGAASLATLYHGLGAAGLWNARRGSNFLDGGAPFYRAYETADGRFVAVAAIEPRFQIALAAALGLPPDDAGGWLLEPHRWSEIGRQLERIFKTRTRDEWCDLLEGTDACVSPVLTFEEASAHPHSRDRDAYVELDGISQPAPAPRFSRTPTEVRNPPRRRGQDTVEVLGDYGFQPSEIAELEAAGILRTA